MEDHYYLRVRKGIEDFCIKNCIREVRVFKSDMDYMSQLQGVDGLLCIGKFSKKEVNDLIRITPTGFQESRLRHNGLSYGIGAQKDSISRRRGICGT